MNLWGRGFQEVGVAFGMIREQCFNCTAIGFIFVGRDDYLEFSQVVARRLVHCDRDVWFEFFGQVETEVLEVCRSL
jgi:hypothetical protein